MIYLLKIKKKLLKYLLNYAFTNKQRIWLLRGSGYTVGNNVYIGEGFIVTDRLIDQGGLVIGNNVGVGQRVIVVPVSGPEHSGLKHYIKTKKAPVIIEDNTWIGAGAILLPGVHVKQYSVVAAGAVVTKSFPARSIIAGVPAKQIGEVNISELDIKSATQ